MPYKYKFDQKASARRHYLNNRSAMVARAKAFNQKHKEKLVAYVARIKSNPCTDCGQCFPPCVMDFDHIKDKENAISEMVSNGVNLTKLMAEISKCELVCANCHRVRTHNRMMARVGGRESRRPHKPEKAGAVPVPAIQLKLIE